MKDALFSLYHGGLNMKQKRFTPDFFDEDYFEKGTKSLYGLKRLDGRFFVPYSEKWYYPRDVDFVKRLEGTNQINFSSQILVIGCAKGFLVGAFRDLGYRAYGMDISRYALLHARSQDKKFLICADVIDQPFKSEYFDFLVASDILEHVPKSYLRKAISETIRLVKGGGFIYLKVPYLHEDTKPPVPEDSEDKSHVSILPIIFWKKAFVPQCQVFFFVSDDSNCVIIFRKESQ